MQFRIWGAVYGASRLRRLLYYKYKCQYCPYRSEVEKIHKIQYLTSGPQNNNTALYVKLSKKRKNKKIQERKEIETTAAMQR